MSMQVKYLNINTQITGATMTTKQIKQWNETIMADALGDEIEPNWEKFKYWVQKYAEIVGKNNPDADINIDIDSCCGYQQSPGFAIFSDGSELDFEDDHTDITNQGKYYTQAWKKFDKKYNL